MSKTHSPVGAADRTETESDLNSKQNREIEEDDEGIKKKKEKNKRRRDGLKGSANFNYNSKRNSDLSVGAALKGKKKENKVLRTRLHSTIMLMPDFTTPALYYYRTLAPMPFLRLAKVLFAPENQYNKKKKKFFVDSTMRPRQRQTKKKILSLIFIRLPMTSFLRTKSRGVNEAMTDAT